MFYKFWCSVRSLTPAPQSTPFVTSCAYMPLTFKAVYPVYTTLTGMFHVCSLLKFFGIANLFRWHIFLFSLYNELRRKSALCFLNIFSVRGRVWGRTTPYVLQLDPICFYVFHGKHRWFGNSEINTSLASPCMWMAREQALSSLERFNVIWLTGMSTSEQYPPNPGNRQSSLSLSVLPQETEAKRSRHRQATQPPASSFPHYLFWTSSHRMVIQAPPKDSHKQ